MLCNISKFTLSTFHHRLLPCFKITLNLLRHFHSRLFAPELFQSLPTPGYHLPFWTPSVCLSIPVTACPASLLFCTGNFRGLKMFISLFSWQRSFFLHRHTSKAEQNESAQQNVIGNWLKYINNVCVYTHALGKGERGIKMLSLASNFWWSNFISIVLQETCNQHKP